MKSFKYLAAFTLLIGHSLGQSVSSATYEIDPDLVDESKITVEYKPNPNFRACSCDMHLGSCDPFCCCDEADCPKAFVTQWITDKQCANETYDSTVKILRPLTECFETDQNEYEFNRDRGLQTYYSPFMNLFCIQFKNAPQIGNFYSANATTPAAAELRIFEDNKENSLRRRAFSGESSTPGDANYQIGDKMKTRAEITYDGQSDTKSRSQYGDALPFPRADSFGNCNNYGSAFFMQDDESTCQQMAKLTDPAGDTLSDCDTLLNADYFTTNLRIFTGVGGTSN